MSDWRNEVITAAEAVKQYGMSAVTFSKMTAAFRVAPLGIVRMQGKRGRGTMLWPAAQIAEAVSMWKGHGKRLRGFAMAELRAEKLRAHYQAKAIGGGGRHWTQGGRDVE